MTGNAAISTMMMAGDKQPDDQYPCFQGSGDVVLGSYTGDAEELVAGAQAVYVLPADKADQVGSPFTLTCMSKSLLLACFAWADACLS